MESELSLSITTHKEHPSKCETAVLVTHSQMTAFKSKLLRGAVVMAFTFVVGKIASMTTARERNSLVDKAYKAPPI